MKDQNFSISSSDPRLPVLKKGVASWFDCTLLSGTVSSFYGISSLFSGICSVLSRICSLHRLSLSP